MSRREEAARRVDEVAVARLAASWLLWYPDDELAEQVPRIAGAVAGLPRDLREPLDAFLDHLDGTALLDVQRHYVAMFDMKRKACLYLSYWTNGDTRNRGMSILRFKQAYLESGADPNDIELADHLAVVLEFAATRDRLTGDALLAEHEAPIRLLRQALADMDSVYRHVLDAVVATLPEATPALRARMAGLAAAGPPTELVGLEPFPTPLTLEPIGGRR